MARLFKLGGGRHVRVKRCAPVGPLAAPTTTTTPCTLALLTILLQPGAPAPINFQLPFPRRPTPIKLSLGPHTYMNKSLRKMLGFLIKCRILHFMCQMNVLIRMLIVQHGVIYSKCRYWLINVIINATCV